MWTKSQTSHAGSPLRWMKVQIRDRLVPADRRHASLVPIAKALGLPALDHRQNIARGMTALLHRHRRNAWQRLAILMGKMRQVADHLDLAVTGNGQIIVHNDPTRFIDRHADGLSDRRSRIARGPDFHPAAE